MVSKDHQTASPNDVISAPVAPRSAPRTIRLPTHTTSAVTITALTTALTVTAPRFFDRMPSLLKARSARRARNCGTTTVMTSRRCVRMNRHRSGDSPIRKARSAANSSQRKFPKMVAHVNQGASGS